MKEDIRHILVLDIETVSSSGSYTDLPADMRHHWDRKARFIRNPDELPDDELFSDRGAIYSEFGKVIVIAVGIFHELENGNMGLRVKSFQSDDEKELLSEFRDFLVQKFDQGTLKLCAHNGKEFDFPYLCRRWLVNEISIPDVLNITGKKPWEVPHIDTMEMWKFGDHKNYTSLDLLASLFGIKSSKSDIDGSQVNHIYYHEDGGLKRIADYCCGDVITTAQLYLKLNSRPTIDPSDITVVTS